ncbi:hypothetical protein [Mycobacterium sp.]|uniref:hypothetical protein n=1 Tax=Mycobacterium sp. TaxID=1785 RepID=UPI003D14D0D5
MIASDAGVRRFIADLAAAEVSARVEGPAVIYAVTPIDGVLAGVEVQTAVSISELHSWPLAVPHWLHFPTSVTFAHSNINTDDCLTGWQRHSRDIGHWDTSSPAARGWLAHVRGALTTATEPA